MREEILYMTVMIVRNGFERVKDGGIRKKVRGVGGNYQLNLEELC